MAAAVVGGRGGLGLWALAVLGWVGTVWLDGLLREAGMPEAAWTAGRRGPGWWRR